MDVKIEPAAAKKIICALLKQQGGLAALATGQVSGIVDHWSMQGVSLYIDSSSPLGRALVNQGVIKP